MKYNVNVKEDNNSTDYIISVSQHDLEESNSIKNQTESKNTVNTQIKENNADPNLCYQIALTEYEHSIKRMERLDNKVYILLTVCAFIFVLLTNAIEEVKKIRLPQCELEYILITGYIIGVIGSIVLVIILLSKLIKSLSSVKMNRFDSFQLVERKMYLADNSQVAGYVIAKMEKARNDNNKLIDKRYKCVDCCVKILKTSVIVLILLSLLGRFVPEVRNEKEPRILDQILNLEQYDSQEEELTEGIQQETEGGNENGREK